MLMPQPECTLEFIQSEGNTTGIQRNRGKKNTKNYQYGSSESGSVSRDFRPPFIFMIRTHLGP